MATPLLRYLSAADVMAAMPGIEERLELAATTMVALVEDAELPPKIGVHPAPVDSFAHAMPAWMRGLADDGSADLLGLKWAVGFPTNAPAGLPAIHATAILSDALTGVPRAIMDAGGITAQRTAAVSGAALMRWGPPTGDGGSRTTVALVGAGVQARSHLPVIDHLLPGAVLVLCDRDPARLALLADEVAAGDHGSAFEDVRTSTDPAAAVESANVVLTIVSFGPDRQSIPEAAFDPDATVVAVDYDMCVPATLAAGAALFLTDDREQFLANRAGEVFQGYPEPKATIGQAITAATSRPEGRVLVSHLGVGLADVVFGDAILRAAETRGIGTLLER
jgi:ornithine cyclodeaminase/alanine dehydrogenase-like protein (mu-crystallin family)